MSFTKDQRDDLINWYFAYPIKDGENTDYVLEKLMEFHQIDEDDLQSVLLSGESLREFYDSEVRDAFIDWD